MVKRNEFTRDVVRRAGRRELAGLELERRVGGEGGRLKVEGWEQRDGRKLALFDQAGVIVVKPPTGASIVTATLDEGAKFTGKAWFDPALGVLVESAVTAEFGIKIGTANTPGTASKVKVTINAKLTDAPNPRATAVAETKPAAAPPAPPSPAGTPPPKP